MKCYWYISLNNKYPYPIRGQYKHVVISVQITNQYSIIEMAREATPKEIDYCKLIYCGYGLYKDKHIIKNINRHCRQLRL
ncbi:hypothetical protein [Melissococcus plutonius]|uniref:hypothetical protein n=1 Tax=Melissococcus plutonius TaxID=33970 RepID=UPI0021E5EDED|nr:hypothetical protein [Melissococcus plutonius]MCV2498224.1 hypothetical protein [Melissococcus plutonius]MCV2506839.1 hypothetical protein [Melissococcus plutonius]MCV2528069.1 hypothetical protein [Melissococcus plutonius]